MPLMRKNSVEKMTLQEKYYAATFSDENLRNMYECRLKERSRSGISPPQVCLQARRRPNDFIDELEGDHGASYRRCQRRSAADRRVMFISLFSAGEVTGEYF